MLMIYIINKSMTKEEQSLNNLLKRVGIFKINIDLIKENPEGVIDVLKDILVVETTTDFLNNTLIYKGCSKHFDILDTGEPIPNYLATVQKVCSWDGRNQMLKVNWARI